MADLALTATAITDVSGATDDDHLVRLWLASTSSAHTRTAYAADAERFRSHVAKPLRAVTVADLSAWVEPFPAPTVRARVV
jgi:hypothetical protein